MAKIAIIEDSREASERVKQLVETVSSEHKVHQAFTLDDALSLIKSDEFDLVVVDIDLGGPQGKFGGFTVLASLYSKRNTVTLVVSGAPQEQVHGQVLSLEAYDFIPKPINDISFVNTFKHALESVKQQRAEGGTETIFALPPDLTRDPNKALAFLWKGRRVNLSLTLARIVELLATNFGQTVLSAALIQQLGTARSKSAVATHITDIRKAFKDIDAEFNAIAADPGKGYVWKTQA